MFSAISTPTPSTATADRARSSGRFAKRWSASRAAATTMTRWTKTAAGHTQRTWCADRPTVPTVSTARLSQAAATSPSATAHPAAANRSPQRRVARHSSTRRATSTSSAAMVTVPLGMPATMTRGPSGVSAIRVVVGTTVEKPPLVHHGGRAITLATICAAVRKPTVTSPPPALEARRLRLPSPSPANCSIRGWVHRMRNTPADQAAVRERRLDQTAAVADGLTRRRRRSTRAAATATGLSRAST